MAIKDIINQCLEKGLEELKQPENMTKIQSNLVQSISGIIMFAGSSCI